LPGKVRHSRCGNALPHRSQVISANPFKSFPGGQRPQMSLQVFVTAPPPQPQRVTGFRDLNSGKQAQAGKRAGVAGIEAECPG
jgi:hypothetical protein